MSSEQPPSEQKGMRLPLTAVEYYVMKIIERRRKLKEPTNAFSIFLAAQEPLPDRIKKDHIMDVLRKLRRKKYLAWTKKSLQKTGHRVRHQYITAAGKEAMEDAGQFFRLLGDTNEPRA